MNVTVDKFGRVLIPKSVRDQLGLKAGSPLRLELSPSSHGTGAIELHPDPAQMLVHDDGLLVFIGAMDVEAFDVVEHLKASREARSDQFTRP